MNLARTIAWRYLRRPTDKLVSAVGTVSVLGLVIGVMALVISMALMTGYRRDLQTKLLGGNAEVFVYAVNGPITNKSGLMQIVRDTPGVAEASPVLLKQALVTTERNANGSEVMLKGVEAARAAGSPMLAKIVGPRRAFDTPEGERGVAVGKYLAAKLGVQAGSSISVTVPSENGGSFMPRTASFVVTNVFDTGFYEFDARWLFIDLREAEQLFDAPGSANLLEVKLVPGAPLDSVTRAIQQRTRHRYAVSDWRDMNRQLFRMLKFQQLVLFIVIGLIVFVSTFNIVSTLIMTVHEKRKEIGILSSMGAESSLLRRIFLWYGTMVGVVGTVAGVLLGVTICWIITRPIELTVISAFSIAVSFVATVIPSMRAARMMAVQALRHE